MLATPRAATGASGCVEFASQVPEVARGVDRNDRRQFCWISPRMSYLGFINFIFCMLLLLLVRGFT